MRASSPTDARQGAAGPWRISLPPRNPKYTHTCTKGGPPPCSQVPIAAAAMPMWAATRWSRRRRPDRPPRLRPGPAPGGLHPDRAGRGPDGRVRRHAAVYPPLRRRAARRVRRPRLTGGPPPRPRACRSRFDLPFAVYCRAGVHARRGALHHRKVSGTMRASSPTEAEQGPAGPCRIFLPPTGNAPLRLRLAAHPPPLAGEALGRLPFERLPCKGSCRRQPTEGCGALPCQYLSGPPGNLTAADGFAAGEIARPTSHPWAGGSTKSAAARQA